MYDEKKKTHKLIRIYLASITALKIVEQKPDGAMKMHKIKEIEQNITDLKAEIALIMPTEEFAKLIKNIEDFEYIAEDFSKVFTRLDNEINRISETRTGYYADYGGANPWILN